jgi:hypothetical protein
MVWQSAQHAKTASALKRGAFSRHLQCVPQKAYGKPPQAELNEW